MDCDQSIKDIKELTDELISESQKLNAIISSAEFDNRPVMESVDCGAKLAVIESVIGGLNRISKKLLILKSFKV